MKRGKMEVEFMKGKNRGIQEGVKGRLKKRGGKKNPSPFYF